MGEAAYWQASGWRALAGALLMKRHFSETDLSVIVLLSMFSLAVVICAVARPVPPGEIPALQLAPKDIDATIAEDRALLVGYSETAAMKSLAVAIREHNLSERGASESGLQIRGRNLDIRFLAGDVRRESGEKGLLALRAKAVEEFEEVMTTPMSEKAPGVLGTFPDVMERYGVVKDGVLKAPAFVLRTLFKSRWSVMLGLGTNWHFSPAEMRAFYGWLALGASATTVAERSTGLETYAKNGGVGHDEAAAGLAWEDHDFERAEAMYRTLLGTKLHFRFRNHAHAARIAAGHALE